MEKKIEELHELSESIYMSGCALDWEDRNDIAEHLYNAGYRKQVWHKVSEELPETSGLYIVCTDKGSVFTAHYYADCGRFNAPFRKSAVWWTDLPEAPKGEHHDS